MTEIMKWVAVEGGICCVCGTASSNVKCGAHTNDSTSYFDFLL